MNENTVAVYNWIIKYVLLSWLFISFFFFQHKENSCYKMHSDNSVLLMNDWLITRMNGVRKKSSLELIFVRGHSGLCTFSVWMFATKFFLFFLFCWMNIFCCLLNHSHFIILKIQCWPFLLWNKWHLMKLFKQF